VTVAILVLMLWLFTAGAGFSVLISSNLKHVRPVPPVPATPDRPVPAAPATPDLPALAVPAAPATPGASGLAPQPEAGRAYRERFDPPSLVAARSAPVVPGARALLEFSHPACGITGLAFWLGFTLVHARVLGWIGFGLAAATACAGLTWFAVNVRAARRSAPSAPRQEPPRDEAPRPEPPRAEASRPEPPRPEPPPHEPSRPEPPAPSFRGRLVALHGAGAALTVVLAALTAVVLHG
jgi:hypothetical protein